MPGAERLRYRQACIEMLFHPPAYTFLDALHIQAALSADFLPVCVAGIILTTLMDYAELNKHALSGWFPGHMLRAGKQLQESIRLVDLLVELLDARAPLSSRNPELLAGQRHKPRILLANKADLADPAVSRQWEAYFAAAGERIMFVNSHRLGNVPRLLQDWKQFAWAGKSRPAFVRPLRIMILGIPNVGKSTLVNRLHRRNKVQVGPKPGVTRQNQWVSLDDGFELLDTPGVIWPRLRDKCHELLLNLLGNIRDEVVEPYLSAQFLCLKLQELGAEQRLIDLIGADAAKAEPEKTLTLYARKRNFLLPGAEPDLERATVAFIKDFRDGKLGSLSLEKPPATDKSF